MCSSSAAADARGGAVNLGRRAREYARDHLRAVRTAQAYNVERLMAEHGDAKLTNLLATPADYPKARSVGVYDRCKAVYEGL